MGLAGFGMLSENMLTGKSDDAGKFARYALVENLDSVSLVPPIADLNNDGLVDFRDLSILTQHWLENSLWP